MSLHPFHPAVRRWFEKHLGEPTPPQVDGWPAIRSGRHTLIAAPTGSGKTLAAFLAAIDDLVRAGIDAGGVLPNATSVVYVSPLKALSNDIQRNLEAPLAGIRAELEAEGLVPVDIRTSVRTGDTTASERARMVRRPPHIVVTTPESLYILLTTERGRALLQTTQTVIVDEIHALVRDKRGSHLALTLERLDALVREHAGAQPPVPADLFGRQNGGRALRRRSDGVLRIGLSATQRPIERVAEFLVGARRAGECTIVDTGHLRTLDLSLELPGSPLEAVMSGEVWEEVYARLTELIEVHQTTLVFVNTRRQAERLARRLTERLGEDAVTSHHGSLSKERRLKAEQRLKAGELKALVATASLELGIDVGAVDLVCQIGSTRSIATFLQRVGRSGHTKGAIPKGRLFPQSRDELVEAVALIDAVSRGELDRVVIPRQPIDILAQQLVAAAASREWEADALFDLVRGAEPYGALERGVFDAVLGMLADGFATRRGRRSAYLHYDRIGGRVRGRRGARLTAVTGGGAIPDNADYDVVMEPSGVLVGSINEDFAIESLAGDIFQLGNTSWRIVRVETGRVRVEDAQGQPPNMPFWLGEAPSRSLELSQAVSRLRREVSRGLADAARGLADAAPGLADAARGRGAADAAAPTAAVARAQVASALAGRLNLPESAAEQLVDYLAAAEAALGVIPTQETLVLERFFDDSGGMQLVVHSPFGSRLNRAWGLALRKRFCQRFNFELQAAATEDAIVLSLGETHSFELKNVFAFVHSKTVRETLTQALLDAPMFETRWRWNASRALAIKRWRSGSKVPPRLQRMDATDLLTVVFPDQVACFENLPGKREIPDHPLVNQTIADCLTEAMDIDRLEALLRSIESGERELVGRDLTEPSPLAQEILGARPYAFLDDAPLEERRTQAVSSRRFLDPDSAADLGALDRAAIDRVTAEAWPDATDADELHDALMTVGFLTAAEAERGGVTFDEEERVCRHAPDVEWPGFLAALAAAGRAARLTLPGGDPVWVAAERLAELWALHPHAPADPLLQVPDFVDPPASEEAALVELVRGRLSGAAVVTALELAQTIGVEEGAAERALLALESEGFVLRGRFRPGAEREEWCERRLLARIHRYTLNRLRREIEPVSSRDFVRFLVDWQRLSTAGRGRGSEMLKAVLEQLEGFEAPAGAWEQELLARRVADYQSGWLDALCLTGEWTWSRLSARSATSNGGRAAPVRSTPVAFLARAHSRRWRRLLRLEHQAAVSTEARQVLEALDGLGAAFFADLKAETGLLATRLEVALAELVAVGLATSDSFAGLRGLLLPNGRRTHPGRRRLARGRLHSAGRWTHLRPPPDASETGRLDEEAVEVVARALLRRYGVIFRRLLDRESAVPPWRQLLRVLRRLEARGEVRGGRFVAGYAGEQFALPEAVGKLRAVRRAALTGECVVVNATDPLNLVGILTPGARLPAVATHCVAFRDGEVVAVRRAQELTFLAPLDRDDAQRLAAVMGGRPKAYGRTMSLAASAVPSRRTK